MALQGALESNGKQSHHLDHCKKGSSQSFQKPSEALETALFSKYIDDPRAQEHEAVCLTSPDELRALTGAQSRLAAAF